MRLRRWCVTVMDNWTPLRVFWTRAAAEKFMERHPNCSHLYRWGRTCWVRA